MNRLRRLPGAPGDAPLPLLPAAVPAACAALALGRRAPRAATDEPGGAP